MLALPPDASTPQGQFLTAYGSWQHARLTSALATFPVPRSPFPVPQHRSSPWLPI